MIFHQKVLKMIIFSGFGRFLKKPWVPPGETRKMGHFSGDFILEIAITFRKVIKKGGPPGGFWGLRSFLGCQYPDISHLLGPSYVML